MENAVILGTFDGVHSGHRAVINAAENHRITAVTFSVPPKAVAQNNIMLLMTKDDRCRALKSAGVSNIVMLDFEKVKNTSALSFLENIKKEYSPSLICCGFNYRFGKDAKGDTDFLKEYCKSRNIECKIADRVVSNGETVSSTSIRNKLLNGDVFSANLEIFSGFGFTSRVIHGDKRGRTIGFPTINQAYPQSLVKLKYGVYLSEVIINGRAYNGITNIGIRPTFKTENVICETYIKDFSGDLYGQDVTLKPKRFLRDEKRFNSLEELKKAIQNDVAKCNNFKGC